MPIKMIVLDLDGTLMDSDHQISKANIAAIHRVKELGVLVTICTGRVLAMSKHVLDKVGCCDYMINNNGSSIYDVKQGAFIEKRFMSPDRVQAVAQCLLDTGAFFESYIDDGAACPAQVFDKWLDTGVPLNYYKRFAKQEIQLDNFLEDIKGYDVFKFFFPHPDEKLLAETKKRVLAIPGVDATMSGTHNFEAFAEGMDKIFGMERLLDALKLDFSQVLAIGDSENDLKLVV